ncbi:hypothetical protein U3516DRAFT_830820 [Neocallimastix sp. 'constans']
MKISPLIKNYIYEEKTKKNDNIKKENFNSTLNQKMDKIIDTLILQRKDVKSEFHKFQKIIANFKDYPFGNKTIKNNVPGKPLEVNKSNSTSNFNNKYFNVITAKNILVNQLKNKLNQLNKLEEFNEELKDILQEFQKQLDKIIQSNSNKIKNDDSSSKRKKKVVSHSINVNQVISENQPSKSSNKIKMNDYNCNNGHLEKNERENSKKIKKGHEKKDLPFQDQNDINVNIKNKSLKNQDRIYIKKENDNEPIKAIKNFVTSFNYLFY